MSVPSMPKTVQIAPPGELIFETVKVLSMSVIVTIDPDPFDVGVTRRE